MLTGGIGIAGTLARPASEREEEGVTPGDETNGLEEVVDWDELERLLAAGEFAYLGQFKAEVMAQFEEAGVTFSRYLYRQVIAGLDPFHRVIYGGLRPGAPRQSPTSNRLDQSAVREIRKRADDGETASALAREYGVSRVAVSDIINQKTWRDVA